jgi:hypothetical protein
LNKTDKIQIPLPINDEGDIDFTIIDAIVDSCQVWNDLKSVYL